MGTRKEVNSGSVGLSKGMSRRVFFSGSARREGRRWCVAELLPDEFWPATNMVWGLVGVLLDTWWLSPVVIWGAWASVSEDVVSVQKVSCSSSLEQWLGELPGY